jgi:hypothetical protein
METGIDTINYAKDRLLKPNSDTVAGLPDHY